MSPNVVIALIFHPLEILEYCVMLSLNSSYVGASHVSQEAITWAISVNLPVGEYLLLSQQQFLELFSALVSQVSHLSLALRPRRGHHG